MSNQKKILIVEDEKKIARFIELDLKHEGYNVDVQYDGRSGLESIKTGDYDLILLDVMMPGLNGMEVCRRARQFSNVPIIMLTAKDEVTDKVMGLDLGANDYLTKPFAIEELLARIRGIFRRSQTVTNNTNIFTINNLTMNTDTYEVKIDDEIIDLTKREYDVLEYLLKNRPIVLTREQILQEIWGYDYFGDTNIVDVYIRYLRIKIDPLYDGKLIHTIRGVGYVIKDE